ncbi:MAG: zinc ribbon domain-containing protein [Chloroflexi bacterium]|nr:zinc ribbon domain-containing protein [Chloroflexota bacterium]
MPIYEFQCHDCGQKSSIFFRSFSAVDKKPRCPQCDSTALSRLISQAGLIQVRGGAESGQLQAISGRKAVENLSRQYDSLKIDPSKGFEEVSRRAAAGDDPTTLKEIVKEAKKDAGLSS